MIGDDLLGYVKFRLMYFLMSAGSICNQRTSKIVMSHRIFTPVNPKMVIE